MARFLSEEVEIGSGSNVEHNHHNFNQICDLSVKSSPLDHPAPCLRAHFGTARVTFRHGSVYISARLGLSSVYDREMTRTPSPPSSSSPPSRNPSPPSSP